MQVTSEFTSTGRRRSGRRVCIASSRRPCVEFLQQSAATPGASVGGASRPGSTVSRGRSALGPLAFSARPGYGPARRPRGAFRPQAHCSLGFAGHHHGVRADQ